jgi:hypothetical protein
MKYTNIYQGKNGGVYLAKEAGYCLLLYKQIEELKLNLNEIKDFNRDDFENFYLKNSLQSSSNDFRLKAKFVFTGIDEKDKKYSGGYFYCNHLNKHYIIDFNSNNFYAVKPETIELIKRRI